MRLPVPKSRSGERDAEVLAASDVEFHRALGRATRNELIEKLYGFVIEYFTPAIQKTHEDRARRLSALRLHEEMAGALCARDTARAEAAIESYDRAWARALMAAGQPRASAAAARGIRASASPRTKRDS